MECGVWINDGDVATVLDDANWSWFGTKKLTIGETTNVLNNFGVRCLNLLKGHYVIYLDDFGITANADARIQYDFYSGTSMASPYVAGAVGTLSNLYEGDTPLQLKDKLLSCVRKSDDLSGKISTSGILDLSNAKENDTFEVIEEYEIQESIITNIQPQTTLENFKTKIESSKEYTVYEGENSISNTDKIKTGQVLTVGEKSFTLIVIGDTNRDGETNIEDILQINKHRLNRIPLTDVDFMAGDVNKDGKADIRDILQINKFRLGKKDKI